LENWRDGKGWERWRFDPGRAPSPEELDALRRRAETARARRGAEAEKRHAAARTRAARIWQAARLAEDGHPYLAQKGVGAHGLRVYKGALVVPLHDRGGELHNLQFIGANGAKRFLKGGQVGGLCFVIDGAADTICLTEGYATAASIHAATGFTVAVAFSAGNLAVVAVMMRAACRGARIIVCADDDADTPGNPGMTNAREAARAIGALLAVPAFGVDRSAGATDFNDLHRARGVGAVRDSISAARPVAGMVCPGNAGAVEAQATDWPEPEPLTEPLESLPHPVEALPSMLREAVTEAQAFIQAPVALVVSSALSAFSLAAQGVANVRRDYQLVGPASLYLLAVADSGERKTTCDAIFSPALRDWESTRRLGLAVDLAEFDTAAAIHEAKKAGILEAIKHKRRRGQDTVARYGLRIRELLDHPLAIDARGCLTPIVLDLSPPARTAWVRFHDEVKRELGATGRFRTVRDVAAKAAEHLARLAALFHLLEHGPQRCIDEADVSAAARVVAWHLNEARRLLTELDTPPTLAAAIRLDNWLRNEALASGSDRVPVKRVYQYGPNRVRDSREFSAALAILAERGRARMQEDGRRRSVAINPALLADWE